LEGAINRLGLSWRGKSANLVIGFLIYDRSNPSGLTILDS
jgi:hypothetical protein